MKIRFTVSMSGAVSYPAFEKDKTGEWVFYDFEDEEALRMVELERAVPQDKKKFDEVKANIEKIKAKKQADLELSENIKNLDVMKAREVELKNELKELSSKIEETDTAINSIEEAKAKAEEEAKAKKVK